MVITSEEVPIGTNKRGNLLIGKQSLFIIGRLPHHSGSPAYRRQAVTCEYISDCYGSLVDKWVSEEVGMLFILYIPL